MLVDSGASRHERNLGGVLGKIQTVSDLFWFAWQLDEVYQYQAVYRTAEIRHQYGTARGEEGISTPISRDEARLGLRTSL